MILFDAVGTLIYADPPVAKVYRDAGRRYGASLSTDEIAVRFQRGLKSHSSDSLESNDEVERRRWRNVVSGVFDELPTAGEKLFDELWRHFSQPDAWRVYDDAEDCLQGLRARGYRLGTASNFDARLRDVARGHSVLSELELFYSSDIGFAKPHAQFFQAIERRLGVRPSQLTLVGDDFEADYQGAISAGWNAVLVHREEQIDLGDATATIRSLVELPGLLATSSS